MNKIKRWIGIAVLCALSVGILSGFSDYRAAALAAENSEAIEETIAGANTVILSLGAFSSETGLTGALSAEELQAQMEEYEEAVGRYFSPEYPAYQEYIDLNAYYLANVFKDTVDYQVSGGVEDSRLVSVSYASEEEARAQAYLRVYQISVVGNETDGYSVACSANIVGADAAVQKIGGEWRVTSMELRVVEDWSHEDGGEGYHSFQEARKAAAEISIQDCCPLSLRDAVGGNAGI